MLADVLQEELKRVGQDLGGVRYPGGLLRGSDRVGLVGVIGGVDGDGAVGECGANLFEGSIAEIELERQRLELGRLDAAALLGFGQEEVNCGDIDRGGQGESFRSVVIVRGRAWCA